MGFFATVFLAFLFMQDMKKNTYELLHTKPIKGWKYIFGKTVSGFLLMLFVLILLNVGFFVLCKIAGYQAGFSAHPLIKGWKYIFGKTVSGFLLMLFVLILLNVGFFVLCKIAGYQAGFSAHPLDFLKSTVFYILPNMVMICSVYGLVSLLFRNPLPAVPMLILYMLYSNMLRIGENGSCRQFLC